MGSHFVPALYLAQVNASIGKERSGGRRRTGVSQKFHSERQGDYLPELYPSLPVDSDTRPHLRVA